MNDEKYKIATVGDRLANIILDSLEKHQEALRISLGGYPLELTEKYNQSVLLLMRVRSLRRIIASQQELITNSRGVVHHLNYEEWKNKNKLSGQQQKNPFSEENTDYKLLLSILEFLKFCEQEIINADRTKTLNDDFLVYGQNNKGEEEAWLSDNFFNMLSELEDSFEEIYKILLRNGILASSIKNDIGKKNRSDF